MRTLRRAGLATAGAVLLAGGLGLFAAYRARSEHDNALRADTLRQRAEQAEHLARIQLAEAQLVRAGLERRSGLAGQHFRALELLRSAATVRPIQTWHAPYCGPAS